MGRFLYALHVAFQAFAAVCRGESGLYDLARAKLRRVQASQDALIGRRRQAHGVVSPVHARKSADLHQALWRQS